MISAIAYCDGRGNCLDGSAATVISINNGMRWRKVVNSVVLGNVTNNIAEYEGMILALDTALRENVTHLRIHSDSQLIVFQVNGKWKVKDQKLLPFRDRARSLSQKFAKCEISWVPREQNTEADALCREVVKNVLKIKTNAVRPRPPGISSSPVG